MAYIDKRKTVGFIANEWFGIESCKVDEVISLIENISAANVEEVKDCDECKYHHRTYANYPCNACRNCYTDKFEAKNGRR